MIRLILILSLLYPTLAHAQQEESYDYWQDDKQMIWRGVQSFLICNGVFTSERSIERVLDQELAYVRGRVDMNLDVAYEIDEAQKTVVVGLDEPSVPAMRSVYRKGLGCIIMSPDQTFDDAQEYPVLSTPPLPGDPKTIPWPDGDLVEPTPLPSDINKDALAAASEWAFDRTTYGTNEQVTLSLMVVHKGQIVLERYAEGVDYLTKTRTWSTAKSIAATLIGTLVDQGTLSLDEPLGIDWLPRLRSQETDPRNAITLRHVLHMASGLYPVDNGLEYATGSGLSYWAGASSIKGARSRALIREPGTYWDYENYDTILAVYAMKKALGSDQAYLEYPRKALFDKIGMRNTIPGVDRFGDFIMSSQIYTNARDLARFGLLYLNRGTWNGERIISEEWIEFVRTPAPATDVRNNFYGGQWWACANRQDRCP